MKKGMGVPQWVARGRTVRATRGLAEIVSDLIGVAPRTSAFAVAARKADTVQAARRLLRQTAREWLAMDPPAVDALLEAWPWETAVNPTNPLETWEVL